MGERARKTPRAIAAARVGLLLGALMLIGCDRPEPEPLGLETNPRAEAVAGSEAAPLLAAAPWFELPEDWNEQHPVLSPNAKPETHWTALAERKVVSHPGDGGGRAWLESVESVGPADTRSVWNRDPARTAAPNLISASSHRFTLRLEVGPHGIHDGGMVFISPEAFWFWSPPQTDDPEAPGFTTAEILADGVKIESFADDGAFVVSGRNLVSGEQIEFVYGAGPRGAQIDRYAEHGSEIILGVDADGDGARRWLPVSVAIDVSARAGHALVAHGPAEIAPGEAFDILVAWVDRVGNRAAWPSSSFREEEDSGPSFRILNRAGATLELAETAERIVARGVREPLAPALIRLTPAPGAGTLRLRVEGLDALAGGAFDLPPIVVRDSKTRLVWGDLHGHSQLSDGTGTPDDYFRYARDVARLDVVALTDHDHWGPRPLDERPEEVQRMIDTAHAWNEPGRFVTIPGYEWTSWLHGHRHVLHFGDDAPLYSSIDPATDRPDELWAALRGRPSLTFAHHSAGEPIATNWFYPPDPELEPLTEIASVHGMSEAPDAPVPVRGAVPGNFVRDALLHGYRLGFIGSGDSHDGHPGLAQIASGQAGLAGLFTPALDRESLLGAMRSRHTFATNGIRPWLEVYIDEVAMGGTLPAKSDATRRESNEDQGHSLRIRYEATAPVIRVDLIRSGRTATLEPEPSLTFELTRAIPRLDPGEFHYVRIEQQDGGTAWSSPIFSD